MSFASLFPALDVERQPCPCVGGRLCGEEPGTLCLVHYEHETAGADPYLRCGECGHLFATPEDLEHLFEVELGYRRAASVIYACPLCAHDF